MSCEQETANTAIPTENELLAAFRVIERLVACRRACRSGDGFAAPDYAQRFALPDGASVFCPEVVALHEPQRRLGQLRQRLVREAENGEATVSIASLLLAWDGPEARVQLNPRRPTRVSRAVTGVELR